MYSRFSTISNQDCTRLLSSIGDFDSTGTFKRVNKLKVLENGFFGGMAKIKLRYMLERFRLNQQET